MKRGGPLKRKTPLRAQGRPRKRPDAAALADYQAQRRRLHEAQGGRCAGCARPHELGALDLSHRIALGMGRSRYDREHPLNDDSNCELLCRPCHLRHEAEVRAARQEWIEGVR